MKEKCEKKHPLKTLACASVDEELKIKSSSGGIFSLLARQILSRKGVVYGTAMDDACKAALVVRIDEETDLYKLRGSKYIQSRIGNAFCLIKKDLENGIPVLFSGTPCQVNGLKNYLREDYDSLYCVDMVCHGTPSPELWKKHVEYLEQKHGGVLKKVNFRCKDKSWSDFGISTEIDGQKSIYVSRKYDPFMQLFLKNYCLRPSCYSCKAKENNMSDITIGDFWGADMYAPEMNDGKGVSIAFLRNDKGIQLFESINEEIRVKAVDYLDAVKDNKAEYTSVDMPIQRRSFFVDFSQMDYISLVNKYIYPSNKLRIKKILIDVGIWEPIEKVRDSIRGGVTRSYAQYGVLYLFKKRCGK